jgi:hypothetical protein
MFWISALMASIKSAFGVGVGSSYSVSGKSLSSIGITK